MEMFCDPLEVISYPLEVAAEAEVDVSVVVVVAMVVKIVVRWLYTSSPKWVI